MEKERGDCINENERYLETTVSGPSKTTTNTNTTTQPHANASQHNNTTATNTHARRPMLDSLTLDLNSVFSRETVTGEGSPKDPKASGGEENQDSPDTASENNEDTLISVLATKTDNSDQTASVKVLLKHISVDGTTKSFTLGSSKNRDDIHIDRETSIDFDIQGRALTFTILSVSSETTLIVKNNQEDQDVTINTAPCDQNEVITLGYNRTARICGDDTITFAGTEANHLYTISFGGNALSTRADIEQLKLCKLKEESASKILKQADILKGLSSELRDTIDRLNEAETREEAQKIIDHVKAKLNTDLVSILDQIATSGNNNNNNKRSRPTRTPLKTNARLSNTPTQYVRPPNHNNQRLHEDHRPRILSSRLTGTVDNCRAGPRGSTSGFIWEENGVGRPRRFHFVTNIKLAVNEKVLFDVAATTFRGKDALDEAVNIEKI